MNRAIAKLIRPTRRTDPRPAADRQGRGDALMDQALLAAVLAKEVDPDDAYAAATDKKRWRSTSSTAACCHGSRPETPDGGPHRRTPRGDLKRNGSDLHFMAGGPPRIRQYGRLMSCARRSLRRNTSRGPVRDHAAGRDRALESKDGCDFAYSLARWRVPRQRAAPPRRHGRRVRAIPSNAMTLDQLKMPRRQEPLQGQQRADPVTGKTGSGKSTTLAP